MEKMTSLGHMSASYKVIGIGDNPYGRRKKKAKPMGSLRLRGMNRPARSVTASPKRRISVRMSIATMNCQRFSFTGLC